jgi:hypothetical protein
MIASINPARVYALVLAPFHSMYALAEPFYYGCWFSESPLGQQLSQNAQALMSSKWFIIHVTVKWSQSAGEWWTALFSSPLSTIVWMLPRRHNLVVTTHAQQLQMNPKLIGPFLLINGKVQRSQRKLHGGNSGFRSTNFKRWMLLQSRRYFRAAGLYKFSAMFSVPRVLWLRHYTGCKDTRMSYTHRVTATIRTHYQVTLFSHLHRRVWSHLIILEAEMV